MPCEGKIIPQKCEIHPGTASQSRAQTKNTAPPKQGMWWCFPGGKFHTIFGDQDGAGTQGRMKSPFFLQIKTFIASVMVHPKPELHSQCHSQELQLPWDGASSTRGSLMQCLSLESSVSSSRDSSLIQELWRAGRNHSFHLSHLTKCKGFACMIQHCRAGSQRAEGTGGECYAQPGILCSMRNAGVLFLTH